MVGDVHREQASERGGVGRRTERLKTEGGIMTTRAHRLTKLKYDDNIWQFSSLPLYRYSNKLSSWTSKNLS